MKIKIKKVKRTNWWLEGRGECLPLGQGWRLGYHEAGVLYVVWVSVVDEPEKRSTVGWT